MYHNPDLEIQRKKTHKNWSPGQGIEPRTYTVASYYRGSKQKLLFKVLSSLEIMQHRIPYLFRKMSIMKIPSMKQERSW